MFTLKGTAAANVTLILSRTSGFSYPATATVTMYAPSGVVAKSFSMSVGLPAATGGQSTFRLEETGTYVLSVNATDFVSTGGYNLTALCFGP